jgi:hypothetical protein
MRLRTVFDAGIAHGDLGATKDMPPGGMLNSHEVCTDALAAASFADPQVEPNARRDRCLNPRIERLQQEMARMAGLICPGSAGDAQMPPANPGSIEWATASSSQLPRWLRRR